MWIGHALFTWGVTGNYADQSLYWRTSTKGKVWIFWQNSHFQKIWTHSCLTAALCIMYWYIHNSFLVCRSTRSKKLSGHAVDLVILWILSRSNFSLVALNLNMIFIFSLVPLNLNMIFVFSLVALNLNIIFVFYHW